MGCFKQKPKTLPEQAKRHWVEWKSTMISIWLASAVVLGLAAKSLTYGVSSLEGILIWNIVLAIITLIATPVLIATTSSRMLLDSTGTPTTTARPTSTYVWLYLLQAAWITAFVPLAVVISQLADEFPDDSQYGYNTRLHKRWTDGLGAYVQNGPLIGCVTGAAYQFPAFCESIYAMICVLKKTRAVTAAGGHQTTSATSQV